MASQVSRSAQSGPLRKPPKVRQACDCCHARKIRCDGKAPCANCTTTALPCTYLAVPKKKGPKGPSSRTPRAVLKMRLNQGDENGSRVRTTPLATVRPKTSPSIAVRSQENVSLPEVVPRAFCPSPLVTRTLVDSHVKSFFEHKYPVTPILDKQCFLGTMKNYQTHPTTYALVVSICAAIISQTQPDSSAASSPHSSVTDPITTPEFFIGEAKRARQYSDYIERPALADVQTSFFLFAALFNADRHNSAWFVLREAMTVLQMLRLHEEGTYTAMEDKVEALFSRRTFWLLFITERAYALQRHRPLTLQRSIDLPQMAAEDPDSPIISGFLDLVSLFQNFDDNFVSMWNLSSRTAALPATLETAAESSHQLSALQTILAMSIPDVSERTEVQQADLLISRQWLKNMVWQLCVTKGLLSSSSEDESMSFHYPVAIARDVVCYSSRLKKESFEPHGPGILAKVFDIGCSLADVLQVDPNSSQFSIPSMQVGPRDYLMEMLKLMSTVFGGNSKYLNMLATKSEECLHTTPRAALTYPTDGQRIIDLDDNEIVATSYESQPVDEYFPLHDSSNTIFDFGSLSEASIAWLGSMADDQYSDSDCISPLRPIVLDANQPLSQQQGRTI